MGMHFIRLLLASGLLSLTMVSVGAKERSAARPAEEAENTPASPALGYVLPKPDRRMFLHFGRTRPTYMLLRVHFGLDGKAEKAEAATGSGSRKVIEYMEEFAAKNWRGPVRLRNGKPVRYTKLIPVSYTFDRR